MVPYGKLRIIQIQRVRERASIGRSRVHHIVVVITWESRRRVARAIRPVANIRDVTRETVPIIIDRVHVLGSPVKNSAVNPATATGLWFICVVLITVFLAQIQIAERV